MWLLLTVTATCRLPIPLCAFTASLWVVLIYVCNWCPAVRLLLCGILIGALLHTPSPPNNAHPFTQPMTSTSHSSRGATELVNRMPRSTVHILLDLFQLRASFVFLILFQDSIFIFGGLLFLCTIWLIAFVCFLFFVCVFWKSSLFQNKVSDFNSLPIWKCTQTVVRTFWSF